MSEPRKSLSKKTTESEATALVIQPVLPPDNTTESPLREPDERLAEAIGLTEAIWLRVIGTRIARLSRPVPATLIGKGLCEEIAEEAEEKSPDVIIVNHSLTPVQQRNLERQWNSKVIDRTGLILEIFGERAQTREGQIQVELAAQEYQKSRLVRSWTHLERQRGGAGFMGGPGETQLEIDRRLITDRITKLKKDLEQVRRNRDLQRKSRERVPYPIIALVGYTNAGKSTLFNRLTGAGVFAEDLLFATLDPTMRKITLASGQEAILSDTVGFIANLPTHLVAAFRSTLEQVAYADIVLHVRDISSPDHDIQKKEVIETLESLGLDYDSDERIIEILNKIDRVPAEEKEDFTRQARFDERKVAISAISGEGVDDLLALIEDRLSRSRQTVSFSIPVANGKALSWLHERGNVLEQTSQGLEQAVTVDLDKADLDRFVKKFKYSYDPVTTAPEANSYGA